MSLRSALNTANDIEVKNDILTISEIDNDFRLEVTFSCFIKDIPVHHPMYGHGEIVDFKNNKWVVNFDTSTSLQEFKTRNLLNYLPI